MKGTYLLIDALSVAFPLAFSASERFGFGRAWPKAWAAVGLSALPFVLWDIVFAGTGFWDFNPLYVLGPSAWGLPLEEWLFFLCIPFACLFIYRQFAGAPRAAPPPARPGKAFTRLFLALAFAGLVLAWLAAPRAYTVAAALAFAAAAAGLGIGRPRYARPLLLGLAAQYVPFLIVNGILTALPVVSYRPEAILGPRIGTIPVEDALYCFALFALPVALYEAFTASGRTAEETAPGIRRAGPPTAASVPAAPGGGPP